MGSRDYFHKGSWNAVCDRCGFKFKSHELKQTWDGFYVCEDDFELRHPLDFIRSRIDNQTVPWIRKEVTAASAAEAGDSYINGAAINQFTLG